MKSKYTNFVLASCTFLVFTLLSIFLIYKRFGYGKDGGMVIKLVLLLTASSTYFYFFKRNIADYFFGFVAGLVCYLIYFFELPKITNNKYTEQILMAGMVYFLGILYYNFTPTKK